MSSIDSTIAFRSVRATQERGVRTVTPSPDGIIDGFRELLRFRELLWMWSLREIKIRYKQSALGIAWAILQPLALMLMFTVIFSHLARFPMDDVPYPVFSYAALVPWTLLATSLTFAVPSLVTNIHLVTKIYFPREILPLACVAAAFLDFLVASLVLVALMAYYGLQLSAALLWVPVLVVLQLLLIIGLTLLVSSITIKYRDVRFIVPLSLQLWMYASPVIYPISLVPENWRSAYMLNPMAALIQGYRNVLLYGQSPQPGELLVGSIISMGVLLVGYSYFKRNEPRFADII